MKFIFKNFLGLLSLLSLSFTRIIITGPEILDSLTMRLSKILESCSEQGFTDITLVTDSKKFIKWTSESLVLSLRRFNEEFSNQLEFQPRRRRKDLSIVVTSSVTQLRSTLNNILTSKLQERTTLFILMDRNTASKCKNAEEFLWNSWRLDLLRATVFCLNSNEIIYLYTFNPYSLDAPEDWVLIKSRFDPEKNHNWTMFRKSYRRGRTSCKDLSFEKAINLDGYLTKTIAIPFQPNVMIKPDVSNCQTYQGIDGYVFRELCNKLNMRVDGKIISNNDASYGYVDSSGQPHGLLVNVSSGLVDLMINTQYIFNKPGLTLSYPHSDTGLSVMTRYVGFEQGGIKLFKFMNPKFIIGILLTFIVSSIFLMLLDKRSLIDASTEIFRQAAGGGFHKIPTSSHARILLLTSALFFVITCAIFSSGSAAVLTLAVPKPNVDDINDLRSSDHLIYCFNGYKQLFIDPRIIPRLVGSEDWNCTKFVVASPKAACVADRSDLLELSYIDNRYLSQKNIFNVLGGFVIRPGWPLLERFNTLLHRLLNAGVISYLKEKSIAVYTRRFLKRDEISKNRNFHKMTMNHLLFAFYILSLGLIISFILFVYELIEFECVKSKRKNSMLNNSKRQIRYPFTL